MRWFAYVDGLGRWNMNKLMTSGEIKEFLRKEFIQGWEAFASIQNYDAQAKIQSCPLYIDVDSSDLYGAWLSTKDAWRKLKEDFGVEPHVYFSGSKGFHLVMPLLIKHERCHLIAREIAEDYCIDLDTSVYTSRRMWRCNGTLNRKTCLYKIKVPSIDCKLDDIMELSASGSKELYAEYSFVYYKSKLFDELVEEAAKDIKPIPDNPIVPIVPFGHLDPCILTLWSLKDIKIGQRHNTLHLLARSCLRSGESKEMAISRFVNHEYWRDYSRYEVVSVVSAVYKGGVGKWTCHGKGIDAKILNEHCIGKECAWHKDFAWKITGLNGTESHETISGCSKIS